VFGGIIPGCHDWRPVELTVEQLDLPFAGSARFVCRDEKLKVYGGGREVCGSADPIPEATTLGQWPADPGSSLLYWMRILYPRVYRHDVVAADVPLVGEPHAPNAKFGNYGPDG
jgi:hypothetical protein